MKNLPFQSIFNVLQDVLPDAWHKVIFYAEYGKSSYSMKYFVDEGNGTFTDCFKLKSVSKRDIIKAFAEIDSYIMPVRKELKPKDIWSVMTLIVDDFGDFHADFEYDDISETSIAYFQMWKERYLQ